VRVAPRRAWPAGRRARVDAEPGLEAVALGVVAPEQLGDVGGLVVGARGDAAADGGVRDVDAALAQLLVQHAGVRDLAGERDADPGAQGIGVDRGAAGGEQDRAAVGVEHRREDRRGRRDRAEHAELQRAADVVDGRLEDGLHELLGGQRRVLEDLDGAEPVGEGADGRREALRVADVGRLDVDGQPLAAQVAGQRVELGPVARDEADGHALAAEAPGDGGAQVRSGSDDDDGLAHGPSLGLHRGP
jgi:hypothetical protein